MEAKDCLAIYDFVAEEVMSMGAWPSVKARATLAQIDETPAYGIPCKLRIPNTEVEELYKEIILDWFENRLDERQYQTLLNSLIHGDIETFSQAFRNFLTSSVSIFDIPFE